MKVNQHNSTRMSLLIARVKFEPESSSSHEPSSSQDPSFLIFRFFFFLFFLFHLFVIFDFFLLFISSVCYFRLRASRKQKEL